VPHHAKVAVAVVIVGLVATVDLRGAIGFSSFDVFIHYALANASDFTQHVEDGRWPRSLNMVGAAGCLILFATLPWPSVTAGLIMFATGLAGRAIVLAGRRPHPTEPARHRTLVYGAGPTKWRALSDTADRRPMGTVE
jgi:basic amino acid/polyamine antiporter, APA family